MSGTTPARTIRIGEELWDLAQARAKREDRNISDVVREALTVYAAGGPAVVLGDLPDGVARHLTTLSPRDQDLLLDAIEEWVGQGRD